MCGIAGIISRSRVTKAAVDRMIRPIVHRGPDDEGVWIDAEAGIGLGHRRLSIVDLSPAGHEPMHSVSGRLVVTFNGEIYNHSEIRAELERRGEVPEVGWRGHSDIETLLQAIDSWGLEPALEQAVGMFAFALWDRKRRRLSLVRDRFGEKPLYYGWVGKDFVFASELKAIRAHPRFDGAIDRRALRLFASRTYVPAPLSIYRGIYKLEPGSILEIDPQSSEPLSEPPSIDHPERGITYRRYWSYREVLRAGLADPIREEAVAVDELERALAQSIQGQSMADVPVGAFLSGGIDSSTVVALYQKYSSQRVRTFTIGFREEAFNEAAFARAVAEHFGTEHHERIVTPGEAQEVIPRLPEMYDEPFADSSQIPTFLVSRFARGEVKVALSGDGGDELFGGYNRYFGTARLWSRLKLLPRPVRAALAGSLGGVSAQSWDRIGGSLRPGGLPPYFGVKVRKSLRTMAGARRLDEVFGAFLDEWAGEPSPVLGGDGASALCAFDLEVGDGAPDALRMMYCDALSYLPDDILCKVDRASMAVSLEARAPFLDHRVAAVAARIPTEMKIRGGSGKQIVKQVLYREAPSGLFERPKAGFGIPLNEWLRGPLRDWADELLDPKRIRAEGWFDPDPIVARWQQHLAGTRDSMPALWAVLMFQAWLRDQDSVAAAAA